MTPGVLPLTSLLLGLTLGWVASTTLRSTQDTTLSAKSSSRRLGNWDRSQVPADIRAKTQAVMNGSTSAERMRAMIELANGIPVSEIEQWLDDGWFATTDGWIDEVCQQILLDRFFGAEPERFMQRLVHRGASHEKSAMEEYMVRWTDSNPEDAMAFLLALPTSHQQKLCKSAVAHLAKTDPSRALELISTFSGDPNLVRQFNPALKLIAKAEGERLLEVSESWPQGYREAALREVGALRMQEDFESGLDWLVDQPVGKHLFAGLCESDGSLAPRILENADLLPEGWLENAAARSMYYLVKGAKLDWLQADAASLGMTQRQLDAMQKYAAMSFGGSEDSRAQAMELVSADSGLNMETRRELVASITGGWMDEDRSEILEWLDGLNEPVLQELGRNRLNREHDPANSNPLPPAEMVRSLGAEPVDDGDSPRFYQSQFWSANETALARETFRSLSEPERDRAAHLLVEEGRFTVGPEMRAEALNHLLREGASEVLEERTLLRRVSETASQWGWNDPAAAARWVESLPAGQEREWAGKNVALAWSSQSEPEMNAWLNSLGDEERQRIAEIFAEE